MEPTIPIAAERGRHRGAFAEWPTWVALVFCYSMWCAALTLWSQTDGFVAAVLLVVLGGYAGALHASLQHEAVHGHPTRSKTLNEALVFPSLSLLFPYRRFRVTHLKHHNDSRLTDPYEDPESWYLAEQDAAGLSRPLRAALAINRSLGGRMLIGPWLSAAGFYRADWRARANPAIRDAYLRHVPAALAPLGVAWGVFGVSPLHYVLLVAWPAVALLMLRTFAEHRAAEQVGERTAIVEADPITSFLFLNNNLHAVHHAHPTRPWYELPALWRRERGAVVQGNGGYVLSGYGEILRRWLLNPKEPVVHPFLARIDRPRIDAVRTGPRERRTDWRRDDGRQADGRRSDLGGDGRTADRGAADVRLAGGPGGDGRPVGGAPAGDRRGDGA